MRPVVTQSSRRCLKTDLEIATEECGVDGPPLSPTGDGAGHPDDSLLIMRNMLPSKDFSHAAHDTETPGDEKAVMGQSCRKDSTRPSPHSRRVAAPSSRTSERAARVSTVHHRHVTDQVHGLVCGLTLLAVVRPQPTRDGA